jgi:hypothetical protein
MESLGEWRSSGVLLHQPFGEEGHPGKVGPSVGINLPKVVLLAHFAASSAAVSFLSTIKLPYRTF